MQMERQVATQRVGSPQMMLHQKGPRLIAMTTQKKMELGLATPCTSNPLLLRHKDLRPAITMTILQTRL